MKISGNEIKVGNIIELDGQLWIAVKTMHTQPGKGGAYMQVELKNIQTGTKKNERFRAAESVLRVYLDEQEYSFLYQEGERFVFMDQTTFEQVSLESFFVGDQAPFLQDGMMVQIAMHEGNPINMRLPEHVTLEVAEADAVVKGQTASSSFKPAVLENGVRIMVPPHITAGMRVVVNTADATYVERAKD